MCHLFLMSTVISEATQKKLLEYINARQSELGCYEKELLTMAAKNCNRMLFKHLFTDIAGPDVTDKKIHEKADELVETIIMEDTKNNFKKFNQQRVVKFLCEWHNELEPSQWKKIYSLNSETK